MPEDEARLDLAYKVTLIGFLALMVAGFACMNAAHLKPPRCHQLTGPSLIIGGAIALIVALNIIHCYETRPFIETPSDDDAS